MITLKTRDGKEIQVMMQDISARGIGFEVLKGKDLRLFRKGHEISHASKWNPELIPKSRFRVQNINGFRVGVIVKK